MLDDLIGVSLGESWMYISTSYWRLVLCYVFGIEAAIDHPLSGKEITFNPSYLSRLPPALYPPIYRTLQGHVPLWGGAR